MDDLWLFDPNTFGITTPTSLLKKIQNIYDVMSAWYDSHPVLCPKVSSHIILLFDSYQLFGI